MTEKFDAVVIGSGPGGYVCAIRLAQLGQKTAVIEREQVGGVCLNWGCIPSKALIHAGNTLEHIREASTMGIVIENPSAHIDVPTLRNWKNGIVTQLTGGIGRLLKANGVELIRGHARLVSKHEIEVEGQDGSQRVSAENIVLATGSRPTELPGMPLSDPRIWSAKGALDVEEIPGHLVIIGGGIIGLELGTAYAKLGSKVTVVELMPQVLTGIDAELARPVTRKLKKLGVTIMTEAKSKGIESRDGFDVLVVETKDGEEALPFDRILVSVGFLPNSQNLGLEAAGVQLSERGFISSDDHGRTNIPNIYAIGDVTGPPFLAHRASKDGIIVAEVISGLSSVKDYQCIPAAIFTDPEIATVGLTEAEAKDQGYELKVGRFPYGALGRALAANAADGFFKIVSDAKTGHILGAGIVGHEASNLIAEVAALIEMAGTVEDLAATVHAHPTFPEGLMEAAEDALGHAIHVSRRKKR